MIAVMGKFLRKDQTDPQMELWIRPQDLVMGRQDEFYTKRNAVHNAVLQGCVT